MRHIVAFEHFEVLLQALEVSEVGGPSAEDVLDPSVAARAAVAEVGVLHSHDHADVELGALAHLGLDVDVAAHALDYSLGDVESQPCALLVQVERVLQLAEVLEQLLQVACLDAQPRVFDLQLYLLLQERLFGVQLGDLEFLHHINPDSYEALQSELESVAQQVHQHLLDALWIGIDDIGNRVGDSLQQLQILERTLLFEQGPNAIQE